MTKVLLLLLTLVLHQVSCIPLYLSNGCLGSNEVGVVGSAAPAACAVTMEYDPATRTIVTATFAWNLLGLETVTAAHLHFGAGIGANSGTRYVLFSAPVGNEVTITNFVLNATAGAAVTAGQAYFNLHTDVRPSGALRGQFSAVAPRTSVYLFDGCSGQNEVGTQGSPLPSWCSLAAPLQLNEATNRISGTIDWTLSTSGDAATAGHIHFGAAIGANSASRHVLWSAPLTAGRFSVFNFQLNGTAVRDIKLGAAYLNIHSRNFTSGALRGQLVAHHARNYRPAYVGDCLGRFEVGTEGAPPPARCFLASAQYDDLSNKLTLGPLTIFLNGADTVTALHLHCGADSASSSGVRFVLPVVAPPGQLVEFPLNSSCVAQLKAGRTYLNVHSASHPSGALRGQVSPEACVLDDSCSSVAAGSGGAVAAAIIFALLFFTLALVFYLYYRKSSNMVVKEDLMKGLLPMEDPDALGNTGH